MMSKATALAGLLAASGTVHLVRPQTFDPIIPGWLPGPRRTWTVGSGLAELACAAALLHPASRRVGGYASTALFAVVFPANVQMLLDARTPRQRAVLTARLPLQVPLIVWAWRVARSARR
jgi:uncharacterized membrane protein